MRVIEQLQHGTDSQRLDTVLTAVHWAVSVETPPKQNAVNEQDPLQTSRLGNPTKQYCQTAKCWIYSEIAR